MKTLSWVLGRLIDATTVISAIAVFLMMAHISVDVIGRFFFRSPLPGTLVFVSNYYMVAVAFLSLAYAERRDAHITVEILTERMAMGVQSGLSFSSTLLSAGVFGMLAWRGLGEAQTKYAMGSFMLEQGVRIPVWPSYYLLPVGAGLMFLVLVFKLLRYLRGGEGAAIDADFR